MSWVHQGNFIMETVWVDKQKKKKKQYQINVNLETKQKILFVI